MFDDAAVLHPVDMHDREVPVPMSRRHAHERSRVSAAVEADGGHAVAFGDDEVENVSAIGEAVAEGLAEDQEAWSVEHGRSQGRASYGAPMPPKLRSAPRSNAS